MRSGKTQTREIGTRRGRHHGGVCGVMGGLHLMASITSDLHDPRPGTPGAGGPGQGQHKRNETE